MSTNTVRGDKSSLSYTTTTSYNNNNKITKTTKQTKQTYHKITNVG